VGEFAAALDGVVSSKPPESQATMAFPVNSYAGGGGYPPAPGPAAGMPPAAGAPAMPAHPTMQSAAAPHPPVPVHAQPADVAGVGYPGAGPYVAPASGQATGGFGETAAGRPVDAAARERRAPSSKLVPILVGVVALVLLGGAAAAFVMLGKKPPESSTAAGSATASASAAPVESAAPSATPSAAPADTGTAAPSDSAQPAASGEADAGPAPIESTLACDPECDEIKVDDKAIEIGKPVTLSPGKHVLVASKTGYVTVKETVTVKAGEKVEKTFKLKEKPAAPTGPATGPGPQGPAKPCGKFLKRCK
jgi:hypothetical protein